MIDIVTEINATRRAVEAGRGRADQDRAVRLRRCYDAPVEDVWDACTSPERISRWFLPVTGDFRPGGRYQRRRSRQRASIPGSRKSRTDRRGAGLLLRALLLRAVAAGLLHRHGGHETRGTAVPRARRLPGLKD
jgi:hypothetical protein